MLKVLSIGSGTALNAFSKGRAAKNDFQHVRIVKNYQMPLELSNYDLMQLDLAEVICIQGTWGSKHIKRSLREENNTASSYNNNINQIIADYAEKNNKPLIVFETMTLSRIRQSYITQKFDEVLPKYYRMGLGHWIYGKTKWLTHYNNHLRVKLMHSNFLEQHKIALNFHQHQWKNNVKGSILIISGLEHDPTNENVEQWLLDTVREIRKYTNREIIIKKHPLSSINLTPIVNQFTNIIQDKGYKNKLKDYIDRTFVAVIDNSTSIFELVDLGIPTFCSENSFGVSLKNTNLSNIENPYYATTEEYVEWVQRMSYTEYTIDELSSWLITERFEELVSMY